MGRSHLANASATRAKGGTGRVPGHGKGQLPGYAPAARKFTVGQSAPGRHGYDAATSVRVAAKSTATTTYYDNADGSHTRKVYQSPVNYRDAAGDWQPIDTRLQVGADGRWHETANAVPVDLAAAADAPVLASLALNATSANGAGAQSAGYGLQGAAHVAGRVSGPALTYPGALPGTDLRVTSTATGLTTDMVLHSASVATSWVFPLTLHGVTASVSPDGSVALRDASGTNVGTIPPSYAYDSRVDKRSGEPATTHAVSYQLVAAAGGVALRMSLDPGWLHDPARVFPVTVDPTFNFTTLSTYVESGTPAADHSVEDFLKIGSYDSGTHSAVSYVQFPTMGIDNSKVSVTAAQLNLRVSYATGCPTAQRFDVAPVTSAWTPSSLRAYPGPALGASIGNLTVATPTACANTAADPSVGDDVVVPLSVATFNAWAAGTAPDYGLGIYASTSDSAHWKFLTSAANPHSIPYLSLTYTGALLPQIIGQYPPSGTAITTLTPVLSAQGEMDPLSSPPNPNGGPQYEYQIFNSGGVKVADSGLVNRTYQVPAGKLQWGQTYVWEVQAYDGAAYSLNPVWYQLNVQVPQPALTSTLAQNQEHGFDPSVGNYTTTATDAEVAAVGPALSVVRDYNSRDPRVSGAFGAAWSSVFDAQAAERYDASGAVASVVVTYPDGSQVGYGRNADGSFAAPAGRAAKLIRLASGYELIDKADTTYMFAQSLGSGVYGISSVADANGRAVTFGWASGHVATMTSGVSGRALHLAWATPGGTSTAHVATVTTDPAVAGQAATALTWTYDYTGDQLSSVCPPGTTTSCSTYAYTTGSPYYTQVMDQSPQSYWPLTEAAGTTAASAVLTNEGSDTGTYNNVGLAATGSPLAGSSVPVPTFNGTSSDVALPDINFGTALAMSLSLWFKMPAGSPAGVLFSSSDVPIAPTTPGANANPTLYVGTDGKLFGQFWFNGQSETPNPVSTSVSVADGNWHHVVFTGSATAQSMYLDGSLVGSVNGWASGAGASNSVMPGLFKYSYIGTGFLGGPPWPDNPYTNDAATLHAMYFTGSIAHVSFYDSTLTAQDVTNLYQASRRSSSLLTAVKRASGKTFASVSYDPVTATVTHLTDENGGSWTINPPTVTGSSQVYRSSVLGAGPLAYYRLGENAGAAVAPSEVKYAAANYASSTLGGSGPFADEPAPTFNGTSSSLQLPTGIMSGATQSVSLWFNTTHAGGVLLSYQATPLTAGSTTASYVPVLYVGSDGKLQGGFWPVAHLASSKPVTDGRWHQVVLSGAATSQSLYLDGALVGSNTGTVTAPESLGMTNDYVGTGYIGGTWPDQPHSGQTTATPLYFNGGIAEVSFFHTALSGAQAAAQWNASQNSGGLTPITTVTVTDPGGKTLSTQYDPVNGNRQISTTDGLGNKTSYGYDTSGFLYTVTDPNGDVITTGHDSDGNTVSQTGCQNQAANRCSTTYSTYSPNTMGVDQATGAAVTVSGSFSGTGWAPAYLVDGNTTSVPTGYGWSSNTSTSSTASAWVQVDLGSARSLDQVDLYPRTDIMGMGFPQAFTVAVSADGTTWTTVTTQTNYPQPTAANPAVFGFTPASVRYVKVTGTTLRKDNNNNYVMQFAELTALNTRPDPTASEILTLRDPRSSSATDNTYRTSYTYDAVGDLTSVTTPPVAGFPNGRTQTVAYTDGNTVAAADSGFAPAGLPYRTTSPAGAVNTVSYLHNGDVASTMDAAGLVTRYGYDNLGRVTSKTVVSDTYPNGLTTTYGYDGLNQVIAEVDPQVTDRVTGAVHTAHLTTTYDPDGGVTRQQVADDTGGDAARVTSTSYNAYDQAASVTDPVGNVTTFSYDGYGNKTAETDPNGNTTASTYDPNGHLLTQVLTNYTGDPVNPQPATALTEESRAYDPAGRLASITDSMGRTTRYTYFDNGLTATATRVDPAGKNPYLLTSDSYDAAGNVTSEITNNGATTTATGYDAASRPVSSTQDAAGVNRSTQTSYTPDDKVATLTRTDGTGSTLSTTATYDPMGRTTSNSVRADGAGHPVAWWRLNQSSGSTVLDSSGSGNTATASGVTWTNSSATFAGSSGQQIVTNGPVLNTMASFTVSAWASVAGGTGFETVAGQDGTNDMGLNLQWDSGAKKWAFSHDNNDDTSPAATRIEASAASPLNTWTHLVGVYDAGVGTLSLYVNGVSQGSVALTTPWAANGPFTIGVGRYNGGPGGLFTGSIGNVQTYQRVLSASEVSTLYNAGRTGATVASSSELTTSWALDKRGLPTAMTDPNGNVTGYGYDEAGHLAVTTAPAVATETNGGSPAQVHPVTTTGYNTFGDQVESQDPDGNVVTTVVDAAGRAVSQTLPNYTPPGSTTPIVATTVNTYDKVGNLAAASDPLNNTTSYRYDQMGDQAQVTAPDGGVTHHTYDTDGERLSTTDPTGAQTQATYDYLGRSLTTTTVDRYPSTSTATTTNSYAASAADPGGAWLASSTSPAGVLTSFAYNNLGETTATTDGAGNTTHYQYDFLGRRTAVVAPDGTSATVAYDQASNPVKTSNLDASGAVLTTRSATFDGDGNMLSATDARGSTTTFSYDATNLLSQEVQPVTATSAITTTFGYDPAGNRTRFTDGRGNPLIYTYNSWNKPESVIEPATATYTSAADRTYTTAYDADGRPVTQTQPGGVTLTGTYDSVGNLRTQSGTGADAPTATRTFEYDLDGRVTSAATSAAGNAPATSESFTYNDRGLLLTASGEAGSSAMSYTADGLPASRTDAAGTTSYTYDTAGRLKTLADPASGTTLTYGYNTLSQVSSIAYGTGGDARTFGYDSLHRLASDTLQTSAGTKVASIVYGYDLNGNVTSKTTSGFAGAAANTYTYDLADRLTSWNNGTTTVAYGYDASGNRTQVGANVYTYDARDQLASDGVNSYTYTARGTLASQATGGTTTAFTFDAYGQAVTQGGQAYNYDALGRVLTATTTSNGNAQHLTYTGTDNTLSADGTNTYTRDPAGALIGIGTPNGSGGSTGTGVLAYTDAHTDVVGDFTATGAALAGSTSYDPLGNVVATSNQTGSLGYQSGWTDKATGRVNMAARWYNPAVGQFQSKDTIAQNPVPDSAAANPFAYVDDNPLAGTDPTGHGWGWHSITHWASSTVHKGASWVSNHIWHPIYNHVVHPVVQAVDTGLHWVDDQYHKEMQRIKDEYNRAMADYRRFEQWYQREMRALNNEIRQARAKAAHAVSTAWHATTSAVDSTAVFLKHHAAAVGAFVVSTAVFMGCEAVLGAATAGVGAVAGAAACGALSGAVGGLVTQGAECFDGQKGACSAGAFLKAGVVGGVVGGIAGLGGALGGKVLSAVGGKALSAVGGLFGRGGAEAVEAGAEGTAEGLASDAASSTADTAAESTAEEAGNTAGQDAARPAARASGEKPATARAASEEPRAGQESDESCLTGAPHSFAGATPVLMANGTSKPIDQITVGDRIQNSVPGSDATQTHTVDKVIVTTTDHDFVDVTVAAVPTGEPTAATPAAGGTPRRFAQAGVTLAAAMAAVVATAGTAAATTGHSAAREVTVHGATLTTTYHHPFYDETQSAFVDAQHLHVGDRLQAPTGSAVVLAVRLYHASQTTYDLTIGALHTYYVVAGNTPLLVHNCGEGANGALRDPATGRFAPNPNRVAPRPSSGLHGNSLNSPRATYLYRLSTDAGTYLKTGITDNPGGRYTQGFMSDKVMEILTSGSRSEMSNLERFIVERDPGPLNFEPWAGSQAGDIP